MTTDTFDTTNIVDESCLNDIFTLQSQTLHDFEFGLEAPDIGSLLELFEENEKKKNDQHASLTSKCNKETARTSNQESQQIIVFPKVKSESSSNKRKGISLLAKPKKLSTMNKKPANTYQQSSITVTTLHLQQDHSYCQKSKKLDDNFYCKIPDYLTSLKSLSPEIANSNENNRLNLEFDKIPSYLKGFSSLTSYDFLVDGDLFDAHIETEIIVSEDMLCKDDDEIEEMESNEVPQEKDSTEDIIVNSDVTDVIVKNDKKDVKLETATATTTSEIFCDNVNVTRQSRSKTRELPKNYSRRRRRISTRSSVASSSHSSTSERSSSCSSCSSCSSSEAYSSSSSGDSEDDFNSNNNSSNNNNRIKIENSPRKRPWKSLNDKRNSKIIYSENHSQTNRPKRLVQANLRSSYSGERSEDIEQRKIVYVGKIPDGTTKADLRLWFGRFGPIKEVSVHFRDFGDNYAFVTFFKRSDAYQAVEHGNDDKRHVKFDLSFGGRRQFCKAKYEDLDYVEDDCNSTTLDFDSLLQSTKAKLIH